jgi:nitrite reductase/ring-hydroxylating ferredoxin subunit
VGAHRVARFDDLPLDRGLVVEVEGRNIGLFRVGEEVRAILNTCPHQGGPVGSGGIFPSVCAKVVDRRLTEWLDHERLVVTCPWHGWEFDLRTGINTADPRRRVRMFETSVEDGDVLVMLPDPMRTATSVPS